MRAMAKQHPDTPLPQDLKVFLTVIRKRSFAAAAEELGQSPAYISKRIGILESTLKTRLLHRTTRRLVLTDDGERTQMWAHRILTDFVDMADDLAQAQTIPRGMLQICSSFGFGRRCVAPAISLLAARHPDLELRLEVFDRAVDGEAHQGASEASEKRRDALFLDNEAGRVQHGECPQARVCLHASLNNIDGHGRAAADPAAHAACEKITSGIPGRHRSCCRGHLREQHVRGVIHGNLGGESQDTLWVLFPTVSAQASQALLVEGAQLLCPALPFSLSRWVSTLSG